MRKYEISYKGIAFVEAETEEEAITKAMNGIIISEEKTDYEFEGSVLIR